MAVLVQGRVYFSQEKIRIRQAIEKKRKGVYRVYGLKFTFFSILVPLENALKELLLRFSSFHRSGSLGARELHCRGRAPEFGGARCCEGVLVFLEGLVLFLFFCGVVWVLWKLVFYCFYFFVGFGVVGFGVDRGRGILEGFWDALLGGLR